MRGGAFVAVVTITSTVVGFDVLVVSLILMFVSTC